MVKSGVPRINPSVSPFLERERTLFGEMGEMPLSALLKSFFLINPLLGAMGLVLTRISRSSNTLKEVHWG
jgi:hypothetical protein